MANDREWQCRTKLLIGQPAIDRLTQSHVMVVGLGGVGAFAAEMLCRAGVGELTIIDGDQVNTSNRNRQLLALKSTVGKDKTDLMENRLKDINPLVRVNKISEFITGEEMDKILEIPYDYVVDAIDTLEPKILLLYKTFNAGYPLVSSMGSGGKTDPTKIEITDISKSYNCKLAHAIRKQLNRLGVRKGFKVAFSPETIDKKSIELVEGERNKKSNVGTISYMPAAFGIALSSVVINELVEV